MQKNAKIISAIEESLDGAMNTGMYFEYINTKGLETLQQEILEKFKCWNCGWCCSCCNVQLTEDDIITLCKHLECDFNLFYEKYMDKETVMNYLVLPCPFLDMNKEKEKCIVYESRPKVCRQFPFNASLLIVDPCLMGKDIINIVDDKVKEKMLDKMSKKDLEGLKERFKKDKEKAKGTMAIYDKLDVFLPQFNEVYGHLVAVMDKDQLLKMIKAMKNR
jgi:Fe-S-cluster containining protein